MRQGPRAMFVEIVRLFIIIALTALGLAVSQRIRVPEEGSHASRYFTIVLGAAIGYVLGGVVGRFLDRFFGTVERRIDESNPGQLFAGFIGALVGALFGIVASIPAFFLAPWWVAYPVAAFLMWVGGSFGFRIFSRRSEALLSMAGLSSKPYVRASSYHTVGDPNSFLLDTSALIDGRILDIVQSGFLRGTFLVTPAVLEELQGLADAADSGRRRKGRRGLHVLELLREQPRVDVLVLDEDVPQHQDVDAKLLSLARDMRISLVTTDSNLQRVAELQGITVLNPNRLATSLRPSKLPGDVMVLAIKKEGEQPDQGVGYLDDGTMVVVEHAASAVGSEIEVQITSSTQTSRGRMLFAIPTSRTEAGVQADAGERSSGETRSTVH
ncbi:MAG: twitching motility protein PilT [Acidimicrobiia bacterium]